MVDYVKYDRQKMKKYGLRDDGDFVERYLRKRVDNPCIPEAVVDARPYAGQMHVDVTLFYDPGCPGIEEFLTKLEMFLMLKVDRIVVWKEPLRVESGDAGPDSDGPGEGPRGEASNKVVEKR